MNRNKLLAVLCLLLICPQLAGAERILIAVASNFALPMEHIASAFEQQTGHEVNLVFGASGRLFAQIHNGAPFQLFFSADQDKPRQLEAADLTVADSSFTYARGALVLWSAQPSTVINGPEVLQSDFEHLALANPELAPYGRAAIEVLAHLGMTAATKARWVQGENITQTFQFVETRNAELGFVALSQVSINGELNRGSGFVIPQSWHSPIRQDAVQLATAADCVACADFMQFMHTDLVTDLLRNFGYSADSEQEQHKATSD